MADFVAKKLTAFFIQCQVIKEDDRDMYEYCFQILLMNIVNFGTIFILGLIFGCIIETLLFVTGFSIIRKQAGGYHSGTPLRCYLLSIANYIIFVVLVMLIQPAWIKNINIVIIALAFIIIWHFAPVADKNKPFCIGEYKRYKRNSRLIVFLIVLLNFFAYLISIIKIRVYMLPLNLGVLFAAVSLISARLFNKDRFITDEL